jgi:hypothetical protein
MMQRHLQTHLEEPGHTSNKQPCALNLSYVTETIKPIALFSAYKRRFCVALITSGPAD